MSEPIVQTPLAPAPPTCPHDYDDDMEDPRDDNPELTAKEIDEEDPEGFLG